MSEIKLDRAFFADVIHTFIKSKGIDSNRPCYYTSAEDIVKKIRDHPDEDPKEIALKYATAHLYEAARAWEQKFEYIDNPIESFPNVPFDVERGKRTLEAKKLFIR